MQVVRQSTLTDAPWYLILCKPNRDHIARRNLERNGHEVFMPRHPVTRRWRDRLRDELRPIFPGYLFVSCDPAAPRWREMSMTPGVAQLVGFGTSGPAQVPSALVTGLALRCDVEGCLLPPVEIMKGDEVRILLGPFATFVGTVEALAENERVSLLLEMMGRKTPVVVPRSALERT